MKTVKEVAKNVATLLNYEPHLADTNYQAVIAELTAFAEERIENAIKNTVAPNVIVSKDWLRSEEKRIRAEALEEAAKVAELYEDGNLGVFGANICVGIAAQIRALKEKL